MDRLVPKIYYESQTGEAGSLPVHADLMVAIDGFEFRGYEPVAYKMMSSAPPMNPENPVGVEDIVIGSPTAMRRHFELMGCTPEPLDYPDSIPKEYYGRKIRKITLLEAVNAFKETDHWLWVKPVMTKKRGFDANLYNGKQLAQLLKRHGGETLVYTCKQETFFAEYRVFVNAGSIMDCRRYKGRYTDPEPNFRDVEHIIDLYRKAEWGNPQAPIAYALDVTSINGSHGTKVVEFNDFWAIGSYGLDPVIYADMLKRRYWQIRHYRG